MTTFSTTLFIVKLISLLLGLTIAYIAFRVGKSGKSKFMIFLAIGFTLIAIGSFIEFILYNILELDADLVHFIESIIIIIGLLFISIPLFGKEEN